MSLLAETVATDAFIARWTSAEQAERTNAQPFLIELCDLLGVGRPDPAAGGLGAYRFERNVTHRDGDARQTTRRIDLYRRDCFILEAKQGANTPPQQDLFGAGSEAARQAVRNSSGWAQHMLRAKGQAEGYVRDLPASEAAPPFLLVCDVGFCFDVYADFSGTGRHYAQFPDRQGFRVYLTDLRRTEMRERLAAVWRDPRSLDPARKRTEVTQDIAHYLARLAVTMEGRYDPETVALFLMRCLFCMFAQSVRLLPDATTFTDILERCQGNPASFVGLVGDLWRQMNVGAFSAAANATVRRFNGGLYAGSPDPLRVTEDEIKLLAIAAKRDWSNVEPAIFGTLLENALTKRERGELGAHFTPRAFVERLVLPAVMEPLRAEWDGHKAASEEKLKAGDKAAAAGLLREFHARLCTVRVLDPACGTGNFLYVTMELMKRLEGEVLDALANLGADQGASEVLGGGVGPRQFLGLEKNRRAVPVAELVLWIGWLQWHFRTYGSSMPNEPILGDFHNIRHADSLLTCDREELARDAKGAPVTRWDGRTFKAHPITGEQVPDEAARTEVTRLVAPRMTEWPEADFIVGNPPFIAGKDMRAELGDGYATALWAVYKKVPNSADIALFFWWRAAQALVKPKATLRRFGFITSNSIRQTFCRRVLAQAMAARRPLRLVFAIPDHPWSDGAGSAAVRIAMTVAEAAKRGSEDVGVLKQVVAEQMGANDVPDVTLSATSARINPDLSIGADPDHALPLLAAAKMTCPGVKLHGAGFIVSLTQAGTLGLGRVNGLDLHIRPYLNGRDLLQRTRGAMVIDLFGLSEYQVRTRFPSVYQHILLHVKPERDENRRAVRRLNWWLFGENVIALRLGIQGLSRFVATVETAKHRIFCFLQGNVLPDNMVTGIATDDAFHLGVLSSRLHVAWALAAGGRLGVGNDPRYNKTRCFDPFPFPDASTDQRRTIAALAEELDALRRIRLDAHPFLTMTGLYNVLEKLRAEQPLTPAERDVHDAGQVSVLGRLHDEIDGAVAGAYGWPRDLAAPQIVERVVALNLERQGEEANGLVRWLRPEYQAPNEQLRAPLAATPTEVAEESVLPSWPARDPERYVALRAALASAPGKPADLSRRFQRANAAKIGAMLETLVALGQARRVEDGRFQA